MKKTKIIKISLPSQTLLMTTYNRHLFIDGQKYFSQIADNVMLLQQNDSLSPEILQLKLMSKEIDFNQAIIHVNDYDLDLEIIITPSQFYGHIFKTDISDNLTTIFAESIKSKLKTYITRTYKSDCGANWGDLRCGINKDFFKQLIKIKSQSDNLVKYEFISGYSGEFYQPILMNENNQTIQIYNLDTINKTFLIEKPSLFNTNQTYHLFAGCHKTKENCLTYQNFSNYLGFLK